MRNRDDGRLLVGHAQVLSKCPNIGEMIRTHAVMKPKQFRRFGGSLTVYCIDCRVAHVLERQDLVLEDRERPRPRFNKAAEVRDHAA